MSFAVTIKESSFWKLLRSFQRLLLVTTSVFVVLIMCTAVLLRYVFKADLFGIEEIVVIAAFWLYFMGSSYGVYERTHVKADIVPQFMSPRGKAILNLVVQFIIAALCLLFTYWAVDMVQYSLTWMPRTTGLRIPVLVSQSSIFFGYVLMSFYSVFYFLDDLLEVLAGRFDTESGQNHD